MLEPAAPPPPDRPPPDRPPRLASWRRSVLPALALALAGCGAAPRGVPETAKALGTPHPFVLEARAPDGRWLVVCQARSDTSGDGEIAVQAGLHGDIGGDLLTPYLIGSSGPGEPIDELVDFDATGRYLTVIQRGRLVLIDSVLGRRLDLSALGADARDDPSRLHGHRAASFDVQRSRLLYLRSRAVGYGSPGAPWTRTTAVVRDVPTGAEIEIGPGPGLLWRAELDGDWVVMHVLTRDTNGDGRIEWATAPGSASGARRCRTPSSSAGPMAQAFGDESEIRIAPVMGGAARVVPDLLRPLGFWLLRRSNEGGLLLEGPDQRAGEIAPAACDARVLDADESRGTVVAACAAAGALAPVWAFGPWGRRAFDFTVPGDIEEQLYAGGKRIAEIEGRLVDLERGTVRQLPEGDETIFTQGARVLVRRQGDLVLLDVDSGLQLRLAAWGEDDGSPLSAGNIVAVGSVVIDIAGARALGRYEGRPLAVGSDGRLLYAVGVREKNGLPVGPLWWEAPLPL